MKKPDEIEFLDALRQEHTKPFASRRFADEIAKELGMHPKRAHGLLEKWSDQGIWESGVSLRSGWFAKP